MVPVEPTAGGAASYSTVQLWRGPRTAHGPSWARGRRCPAEHVAPSIKADGEETRQSRYNPNRV